MSRKLKKLIDQDGIRGVTSNPKIFKEAIAKGEQYENDLRSLAQKNKSKQEIYQALIGAETINTMPQKTIGAYRDHGNPAPRLEEDFKREKRYGSR